MAIYYSLIMTAKENGLNPFEYLTWIFINAPNIGKLGYVSNVEELLPSSNNLPEKIFTPKLEKEKPDYYAWEEERYG